MISVLTRNKKEPNYLLKNNKNTTPVFTFSDFAARRLKTAFPWLQNRSHDSFPGHTWSSFSS